MATHIFDIDGTLVKYHTNDWIEGALETLEKLSKDGHKIVLITMRGPQDDNNDWSIRNTISTVIRELNVKNIKHTILWGHPSPRIVHDDAEIQLDKRVTNQKW